MPVTANRKVIKVSIPKSRQQYCNAIDDLYQEELQKFTNEAFMNASTTNTVKHIKACLAKCLKNKYNLKDKETLTKCVTEILAIHGLSDVHFDPMTNFSKLLTGKTNDVSIDDNGNKDGHKAIKGIIKEAELSFDKLIGYDYLYRTIKELYGKDEATRLMGEMFDFSLGLHDSTKILIPYSYYGKTAVIIRDANKVKNLTLEALFNKYAKHAKRVSEDETDDSLWVDVNSLSKEPQLQVWDSENGFVNISRIVKHKNEKDYVIYKTNRGNVAIVTSDHPVYLVDGKEKLAADLEINEALLMDVKNTPVDVVKSITVLNGATYYKRFLDETDPDYLDTLHMNSICFTDAAKEKILGGVIDNLENVKIVKNTVQLSFTNFTIFNQFYDILKDYDSTKIYAIEKDADISNINKLSFRLKFSITCKSGLIENSQKIKVKYLKSKNMFAVPDKLKANPQEEYVVEKYVFTLEDVSDSLLKNNLEYVYDITTDTGRFYANGMIQHNCWALDASKLVLEGRPFGILPSKPSKSIDSYLDCLCDSIPELTNHVAGAISVATLFLDMAHLLIYKQRVSLDRVKNDASFKKYLENRFQKFIHSVNHPVRDSIESPFTNISIFDKEKLHGFINEDNYQWYFPNKTAVAIDNNLLPVSEEKLSREAFDDFVVEYIFELQKQFVDFFDKGDPAQNGLQYRFPVVTVNLSKHASENGISVLDDNNELQQFISKKDIARYNIFVSEGTKIASCCRMINDQEMIDQLGSTVNSFGGSGGASLGSHRVVTINFARIAYEANSYAEYKEILEDRIYSSAKILKAHKILLLKLMEMGTQPFMSRGWIDPGRLFSTFGVSGLYEANIILNEKFGKPENNEKGFYIKDILEFFSEISQLAGKKEQLIINREQVPGESLNVKLAKVDTLLFENPFDLLPIYANQFVPTWIESSISNKMKTEGKYDKYLSGGSIAHFQIGTDITSSQAKKIIKEAVAAGCEHFALNAVYSRCKKCGQVHKANWITCPHCGSQNIEHLSRVVGFFVVMENINAVRREHDWPNRKFFSMEEVQEEKNNP